VLTGQDIKICLKYEALEADEQAQVGVVFNL
jgi:hypothetical protein